MLNLDVLNRCWVTEFPCGHIVSEEKKKKVPLGLQQLVTETISSKVTKPLGVDKVTSVLCFGTVLFYCTVVLLSKSHYHIIMNLYLLVGKYLHSGRQQKCSLCCIKKQTNKNI